MSYIFGVVIVYATIIQYSISVTWKQLTPSLPVGIGGIAVGHDANTHSIWLLQRNSTDNEYPAGSFMRYDISNKSFDIFSDLTYNYEYQWGESYTQIGNKLYIDAYKNFLAMFDMDTLIFSSRFISKPSSWTGSTGDSCMTSYADKYLFLIGGYEDTFIIYDLQNDVWLDGPNIPHPRAGQTCIIYDNILYVISGWGLPIAPNNNVFTHKILTLNVPTNDISTIDEKKWVYLNDTLSWARGGLRSIIHNRYIYIISGYWPWYRTSQIIDTTTGDIGQVPGELIEERTAPAVIYSEEENILYVFGGHDSNFRGSKIVQYAEMPPIEVPTEEAIEFYYVCLADSDLPILYTLLCIFGIFLIIFIMNIVHSKKSYDDKYDCCFIKIFKCNKADSNRGVALIIVALRIGDFLTDFILTTEILYAFTSCIEYLDDSKNQLLLILVICAAISLFLPWIMNILFMFGVTKLKNIIIQRPKLYFENKRLMAFYIFVTLITGDSYTTTMLMSSNIFGLNVFNSGLNSAQFRKIRVYKVCSILFENIPQCIVQFTFGLAILNKIDGLIITSFIFSLLSSSSNIISWFLNRNIDKQYAIKQYLINVTTTKSSLSSNIVNELNKNDKITKQFMRYCRCNKKIQIAMIKRLKSGVNTANTKNDANDNINIMPDSCIFEVGYVTVNDKGGCSINIVHGIISEDRKNILKTNQIIRGYYDNKYELIAQDIKDIFKLDMECEIDLHFNDENGANQFMIMDKRNKDNTDNNAAELETQFALNTMSEIELNETKSDAASNTESPITTSTKSVSSRSFTPNTTSFKLSPSSSLVIAAANCPLNGFSLNFV